MPSVEQLIDRTAQGLASPVSAMRQADERIFYVYLLGALGIAMLVWWRTERKRQSLLRYLFSREVWLHRSALFDLRFMIARGVLSALVLTPIAVSSVVVARWTHQHLVVLWTGPEEAASHGVALAVVTALAFIGDDVARYWVHRLAHRVPALWELHKVHHSAEVLTPMTIYRTHPLEGMLMQAGASTGLGVFAAVGAWLMGSPLAAWEVLGVQGLSFVWNLLGSNLRHSHVWLSYPRWLERLLISPAQHQIHHSDARCHYATNFGSAFAFWDWMFGSLYVTRGKEELRFGLAPEVMNHDHKVLSAIFGPILAALRRLRPAWVR